MQGFTAEKFHWWQLAQAASLALLVNLWVSCTLHAQQQEWDCFDAVFPVTLELRTTDNPFALDARIDSAGFVLPPDSIAKVDADPDATVFLGHLVSSVHISEFESESVIAPVTVSAASLIGDIDFYSGKGGCGDDVEERFNKLENNSEDDRKVCGSGQVEVNVTNNDDATFVANLTNEWTAVTSFTVTVELSGNWEETDMDPPNGLCE